MKTIRRIVLAACLAGGAFCSADEPAPESNADRLQGVMLQLRQIAVMGRYEHALRAVDMNLIRFPGDPQLLAFRAQVLALLERHTGQVSAQGDATVHLPAIANLRPEAGQSFTTGTAAIAMIWIAPGSFLMSNPLGSDDDTYVTLSHGYWLGRTEVTQVQWQAIMDNMPSPSQMKGYDRPVERVSWGISMEFCRKFTERERAVGRVPEGYEYTLPTEAEWEYACRAGTTGPLAGNIGDMAWFELNSDQQTHPVGQKQPNAWGLYDMHGNVSEWCLDGYVGYPGGRVTDLIGRYDGPSSGTSRIMRGGGWSSSAGQCRSDTRNWSALNFTNSGVGLRLALAPVRRHITGEQ